MTDSNPSIVAPVSRLLAVAELGRGLAFYRDVLGFKLESPPAPGPGEPGAEVVTRNEITFGQPFE